MDRHNALFPVLAAGTINCSLTRSTSSHWRPTNSERRRPLVLMAIRTMATHWAGGSRILACSLRVRKYHPSNARCSPSVGSGNGIAVQDAIAVLDVHRTLQGNELTLIVASDARLSCA